MRLEEMTNKAYENVPVAAESREPNMRERLEKICEYAYECEALTQSINSKLFEPSPTACNPTNGVNSQSDNAEEKMQKLFRILVNVSDLLRYINDRL